MLSDTPRPHAFGDHGRSWTIGTTIPSSNIEYGIDCALSRGRVVVLAVGNQGSAVRYPARLMNTLAPLGTSRAIIAVGATDSNDAPTSWSNFGDARVSVVAPGLRLMTTDIMETGAAKRGYCRGGYAVFSGTSAAAPLVSGTAALMLSLDPKLSPQPPSSLQLD